MYCQELQDSTVYISSNAAPPTAATSAASAEADKIASAAAAASAAPLPVPKGNTQNQRTQLCMQLLAHLNTVARPGKESAAAAVAQVALKPVSLADPALTTFWEE